MTKYLSFVNDKGNNERLHGFAKIQTTTYTNTIMKKYFDKDNYYHRIDGPAFLAIRGATYNKYTSKYYIHGKRL